MEDHEVTLKLGHGQMSLGNERVVLHGENAKKGCCRIIMGNTLTIPPRSCKIVDADVDMSEAMHWKSAQNRVCAVECLPILAETMGVVMGSKVVEVQNEKVLVNW